MRSGMRFSMTDKSRLLREGLSTNIAHVRSHAGMNEQVLLQRRPTSESFAANGTTVRFVTGVNPHVDLQSAVTRESLSAFLADDVLLSLVLPDHVLVQILLTHHSPLAHLALVLRLVMSELLMHVKRIAVQTSFTTNVADDRLLSVTESYVICQVTLHLELLPASLARKFEVVRVLPSDVNLQFVLVLVLVIALIAVKQFGLIRSRARSARLVLPLDVRIEGRSFDRLEVALVARVNLVQGLDFVLTLVGVQRALFRALEVAQVATFLQGSLVVVFLGNVTRHGGSFLATKRTARARKYRSTALRHLVIQFLLLFRRRDRAAPLARSS